MDLDLAIPGQYYPQPPIETFFARAKRAALKTKEKVIFVGATTKKKIKRVRRIKKAEPSEPQKKLLSFGGIATFFYFLLFTAISVIIFASVLRGVPGNPTAADIKTNLENRSQPFELSPERGRYASVMALDENKTFALSAQLRDVAYPDVGYIDGRYYSYFAPGISVLAYPFYEIGKQFDLAQVASFSVISLFALLNMFLIFKISRSIFKLPRWAALFGAITFAFASTSLSYANTLYQHHVTTFFILSSFYAVWRFSQKTKFSFLWTIFVWINYGLSISIDYPNALLMLPVMVYLLIETVKFVRTQQRLLVSVRFSSILTIVFFVGLVGILGYFNYANFGSPLQVSQGLIGYKEIKDFHLFQGPNSAERLKQFEALKQPVGFFKEENFPRGLYILLFESDKGIFFFAPIFLIALLDLFYIVPRLDRRYGVLIATVLVNLFLYSSFDDPWGGYAFGPRYLIPTMGILSIFVAEWLYHTKKQLIMKVLAFALFIYSAAVALLGALTTNSVPPSVEAVALHAKDNYLLNLSILQKGISSSYVYNTFFQSMTLSDYYFAIFSLVLFLAFTTLFIYPLFTHYDD